GDDLADMIRRVVCHEKKLAKVRLARARRNRCEQFATWIHDQTLEAPAVPAISRDAGGPRARVRRLRVGRPIVRRPRLLLVVLLQAELEDVRLREANV